MIGDSNMQFPSGESTVAILHHSLSSPCSEGARPRGRSGAGPAADFAQPRALGSARVAILTFPSCVMVV
jgi:hypothetical protein